MKNIVLVSLPKLDTAYPSGSLAIISSIIKESNRDVKIFDFNLKLFAELTNTEWHDLEAWCSFVGTELSSEISRKIKNIFIAGINDYITENTEYVGFSVFSYFSNRIATLVLTWYKEHFDIDCIVGGSGVSTNTSPTNLQLFGEYVLENSLAKYVIFGEGEVALLELLKGNDQYFGINKNTPLQINDLSVLPAPTYKFYDMTAYQKKKILITGSRGCVRHCTFCDIDLTWPKFRFREAKHIIDEIKRHFYDYGITEFEFTDSLINGSTSNFNKFNEMLFNEKEKYPDLKDIRYQGQFICRPKEHQPEYAYELMHLAGCNMITVGIESFSHNVRLHMKKKFSNEDIAYHLHESSRWGIPNIFLMIVGYPTETLSDHQENINAVIKYQKYATMGTIFMIRWGSTMHLYNNTPILGMAEDLGIHFYNSDEFLDNVYGWSRGDNTLKERIRRRLELHELCVNLGYRMPRVYEELQSLKKLTEYC